MDIIIFLQDLNDHVLSLVDDINAPTSHRFAKVTEARGFLRQHLSKSTGYWWDWNDDNARHEQLTMCFYAVCGGRDVTDELTALV